MQLHDARGKRLYLTAEERVAFLAAAARAGRWAPCVVCFLDGCTLRHYEGAARGMLDEHGGSNL